MCTNYNEDDYTTVYEEELPAEELELNEEVNEPEYDNRWRMTASGSKRPITN